MHLLTQIVAQNGALCEEDMTIKPLYIIRSKQPKGITQ